MLVIELFNGALWEAGTTISVAGTDTGTLLPSSVWTPMNRYQWCQNLFSVAWYSEYHKTPVDLKPHSSGVLLLQDWGWHKHPCRRPLALW